MPIKFNVVSVEFEEEESVKEFEKTMETWMNTGWDVVGCSAIKIKDIDSPEKQLIRFYGFLRKEESLDFTPEVIGKI